MRRFRTSLKFCVGATVIAACAAPPDHRPKENSFDTNHDGYLSREEYSASELSGLLKFEELDTDEDGLLSEAELRIGGGKGDSRPRGKGGPKGARRT